MTQRVQTSAKDCLFRNFKLVYNLVIWLITKLVDIIVLTYSE